MIKSNILDINRNELLQKQVVAIDKPLHWTSNDVVQYLKHYFKLQKVGHAGTLDPLATGVLIIAINQGTKKLTNLVNDDKEYLVDIQLGIATESYDLDTPIVAEKSVDSTLTKQKINEVIHNHFINQDYYQYPPLYSAKKVQGRKLYQYARNGQSVEITPTLVKIKSFMVNDYNTRNHIITLSMNVSKGFYIRSFANDLGKQLNTYGTVTKLVRIKSGQYSLADCYSLIKK